MIYVITGRRELGKTTLARYLASKRTPQLIIDPRAQWKLSDGDRVTDDAALAGDAIDANEAIVVQPRDLQSTVDDLGAVVQDFVSDRDRRLAVVFDEARLYKLHAWDWVFRCCSRDNVVLILTAHRPQDIPTDIRAILDVWCIFRTTQQHDLQSIAERTSDACARVVASLPPRHFVSWDDATIDDERVMTVHRHPELWREPAGETSADLIGEPVRRASLW